ncbi:MAG: hypothetical protein GKS06_01915 [Acidobacteria bacterium]|nr:hypothetical protein [Acidobacteriota bacterium]
MPAYNYANFPLDMEEADFLAFPSALQVGERAPNGEVVDAATGETVKLSRFWSSGPCVIEFGSIT